MKLKMFSLKFARDNFPGIENKMEFPINKQRMTRTLVSLYIFNDNNIYHHI
jgi:hypothetical protein